MTKQTSYTGPMQYCPTPPPRPRCLILLTLFALSLLLLWMAYVTRYHVTFSALPTFSAPGARSLLLRRPVCRNVLTNMTTGHWHQHKMTSSQQFDMKMFHMKVYLEHGLPTGLQRPDLQCGNVTFGPYAPPMHPLLWYRALCDPEGATPCCYKNNCEDRKPEHCDCADCYDMRRAIQAEYARWVPVDSACVPERLSVGELCHLLEGATLYFIGDSYVRHVFTALLLAARGDEVSGAIALYAPPGIRAACHGIYMFTEKLCRHWLDRNASMCQGRTQARFFELVFVKQAAQIHDTVLQLLDVSRSFVFIGTGVHDNFPANDTQSLILRPLLDRLHNHTYPKILWAATHAPGLLKTPRVPVQSGESVRRYNAQIARFLRQYEVPVLDTYNMTDGVMSFDGAHYGLGVNRVKVRILLAHLMELYRRHAW